MSHSWEAYSQAWDAWKTEEEEKLKLEIEFVTSDDWR